MLTDEDTIEFGKHKGEKIKHVPPSYLLWWYDQSKALVDYIDKHRALLEKEAEGK